MKKLEINICDNEGRLRNVDQIVDELKKAHGRLEIQAMSEHQLFLQGRFESRVNAQIMTHPTKGEIMPTGIHWSDCSTNNGGVPELLGPCDCGADAPTPTQRIAKEKCPSCWYDPPWCSHECFDHHNPNPASE